MESPIPSPSPNSDVPATAEDRPATPVAEQPEPSSSGQAPLLVTHGSAPQGTTPGATERVLPTNPRVLILSCQQTKLTSLSPFQRKDACDRLGKVTRCDRLRDGSLEVEFANVTEASKALRASSLTYTVRTRGKKSDVTLPISVTPHISKNFRKGVINCYELRGTTDDEITEGLSSCGVVAARRITVRKGGSTIPTNNIVLTFDAADLPPTVTVGYTRVNVRHYVPNPMRCFRCQRFGHTKTHCRNRPVCSKCTSPEHLDGDCNAVTLRCVNCGDQAPHASYDRSCPQYLKQKEILAIQATKNVSFREARDIFKQTHPDVSYAQKAKAHVSDKTTLECMSASHLISLLKSFGLSVVASGATPGGAAPPATAAPAAPPPARPATNPSSSSSTSSITLESLGQGGPAAQARSTVATTTGAEAGDDGWTEVQRRRTAGRRTSSPLQPAPPGEPSGTQPPHRLPARELAVMAAQRHGQEEKDARDARRARLADRAREGQRPSRGIPPPGPPGGAAPTAPPKTAQPSPKSGTSAASSTAPAGERSPMGPPSAPTPPQRPRVPPPPLPTGSGGEQPPRTPRSAPRPLEPPPAPARPGKRALALNGSPSEGDMPRSRFKPQNHVSGGRSASADGRLPQDTNHPRIRYRDGAV